jgi:hypothetical protein
MTQLPPFGNCWFDVTDCFVEADHPLRPGSTPTRRCSISPAIKVNGGDDYAADSHLPAWPL